MVVQETELKEANSLAGLFQRIVEDCKVRLFVNNQLNITVFNESTSVPIIANTITASHLVNVPLCPDNWSERVACASGAN